MKREKGSGNRVGAKDFAAIHIQIYILLIFLIWIYIRIPIELAKD
jgi:diacylglycerol kinase